MTSPYADTADTYYAAGWRGILPLPYKAKKNPPAGFTGSTGTDPTYPDIATWVQDGDRNICLRLPDHIIGLDVDAYGDKVGALTLQTAETEYGPLPPTWRSTSRDDGISGIRLYRIPAGLAWPGEVGPGIETVRKDHRYVVCAPSVHPDTGNTYRWIDPDGIVSARNVPDPDKLPYLPDEWVIGLTGGEQAREITRNTLKKDAAMLWIAQRPQAAGQPCPRMDKASTQAIADMGDHSAHQTALASTSRLMRLADEGHAGIVTALLAVKDAFTAEVTRPERTLADKTLRTAAEADHEWDSILISGVNFVSAEPLNLPVCDCDGLLADHIVGETSQPSDNTANDTTNTADQPPAGAYKYPQMVDGATFILSAPDQPPAVWGWGDNVLWAEGESLILVGPPGVGKTTICGQVVKARLKGGSVLGYGVKPTDTKVLYLAMDRPDQIARSLRRHFTEDDRQLLADKFVAWKGPPPADVAKNTGILVALVKLAGADTLIVDSIKDAAIGLSSDEVGAAYNQARQLVLAAGAQMLELHHLVKRGPNGAKPTQLADVYGSTWITSGAGSVALVWGQAGDLIVELTHLKQPANDIGPLTIEHDHKAGISTVYHGEAGESAPLEVLLLSNRAHGLTAHAAAAHMHNTTDPDANQKKKAKRHLDTLVHRGLARVESGAKSGHASRWFPADNPEGGVDTGVDRGGHSPTRGVDMGVDMGGGHGVDRGGHSPTTGVDKGGHGGVDTPTPSLDGGLSGVRAENVQVRACETCGTDTKHAGARFCKPCADRSINGHRP